MNAIDDLVSKKGVGIIHLKNEIAKNFDKNVDGNFQTVWNAFVKMHELSEFAFDYDAQKTFLETNIKYC